MNNFLTLLKISIKTNLSSSQNFSTRKKAGNTAVLAILIVIMGGYAFLLAYQMGKQFSANGMENLLMLFAIIGSVFFTFLNSIISSFHFIFKSKDQDLLLSMPIPVTQIFLAKALSMLALLYIYVAPVYIPFFIAYFIFAGVNAAMVIYAILGFFLTPLFAFAIGLIIGMLLNSMNSLRAAKPLYIIFMIAFIVLVMIISGNPTAAMNYLSGNSQNIISTAGIVYFPYYLLSKAIQNSSFLNFLAFFAINIVPIGVLVLVSSKYYVKLTSFFARGQKTKKFEYKESVNNNVMGVLVKKELKRLISSANYLINSCIGPLMLIVLVVINMVSGAISEMLGEQITVMAVLYIAFTTLLNSPLAVSISLEGESFWIYKSMPIKPSQILNAKILMQLIIFLPLSLIGMVLFVIVFKIGISGIIMLALFTIIINLFGAMLGMTIGLKKYNLHYTNELQIVKQSSAVFITMIVGLIISATIFVPYLFIDKYIPETWYVLIINAILAIITFIMYQKLMSITTEDFNKIN